MEVDSVMINSVCCKPSRRKVHTLGDMAKDAKKDIGIIRNNNLIVTIISSPLEAELSKWGNMKG
jgi:hypothetical protein